jgi:hypothetical protein
MRTRNRDKARLELDQQRKESAVGLGKKKPCGGKHYVHHLEDIPKRLVRLHVCSCGKVLKRTPLKLKRT